MGKGRVVLVLAVLAAASWLGSRPAGRMGIDGDDDDDDGEGAVLVLVMGTGDLGWWL